MTDKKKTPKGIRTAEEFHQWHEYVAEGLGSGNLIPARANSLIATLRGVAHLKVVWPLQMLKIASRFEMKKHPFKIGWIDEVVEKNKMAEQVEIAAA